MWIVMLMIYILISFQKNSIITRKDFSSITIQLVQNHANGMIKIVSFMRLECTIWWISRSLVGREHSTSNPFHGKIFQTSNNRKERFGLRLEKEEPSYRLSIISSLGTSFLLREREERISLWLQKSRSNLESRKSRVETPLPCLFLYLSF